MTRYIWLLVGLIAVVCAAPAEGALFRVGSFTGPQTSSTAQSIPHGLGVQPQALLLWTVGKTDASQPNSFVFGLGASSGSGASQAISAAERSGVPRTTQASRRMSGKALTMVQADATILAEADLTTWDASQFTLSWTTNNPAPHQVHYLVIGGAGVAAQTTSWRIPSRAGMGPPPMAGPQTVTGVGFRPDVVLHFHAGLPDTAPPPVSFTHALVGLGAMDAVGGQWSSALFAWDANTISNDGTTSGRDHLGTSTLYKIVGTGMPGVAQRGQWRSMNPDGFTVNWDFNDGNGLFLASLSLAGVTAKAGLFTKRTAVGPQPVTGVGFRPGAVLLTSTFQNPPRQQSSARLGLGASDGVNQQSIAFADVSNAQPSVAMGRDSTTRAFLEMNNGTGAIDAQARLSSLDPDGFTLDWISNDPLPIEIQYLALGGAEPNQPPPLPDAAPSPDDAAPASNPPPLDGAAGASDVDGGGSAGAAGASLDGGGGSGGVAGPPADGPTFGRTDGGTVTDLRLHVGCACRAGGGGGSGGPGLWLFWLALLCRRRRRPTRR